jgi:DNA invertase Pin-like site-specific DNA recombinase
MSTPQQPNSLAQQAAVIGAFAQHRRYEIDRSYEDAALRGVGARKRPVFQELLATVLRGRADFEAILVYDVSRWGRFQDPDEAAHYEVVCGQEGVRIEYCAEAFGQGADAPDVLMKALKRAMAAVLTRA